MQLARLAFLFFVSFCVSLSKAGVYDVAIVGGGMSGLTTALRLSQAGGISVIVIEADAKLGGRTRSEHLYANMSISVGGTWALFENTATLHLAHEVGAEPFTPIIVPQVLGFQNLATHPYLLMELWLIGYSVSAHRDDYWNAPQAPYYDSLSVADWLAQMRLTWNDPAAEAAVVEWLYLMENFPFNLSLCSTLHTSVMVYKRLRLTSSSGLYTKGLYRWEGGTGVLVDAIVNRLRAYGVTFITGQRVTAVNYTGPNPPVALTLANGTTISAKRAVLAVSPTAAGNISFSPVLANQYTGFFRSIQPLDVPSPQLVLTWTNQWWLPEGNVILPEPETLPTCGVWGQTFELSPTGDPRGVFRILAVPQTIDCFAGNQSALAQAALDWLAAQYRLPQTQNAIHTNFLDLSIFDWRDHKPHIPGVTFYYPPNGSLVTYGDAIRATVSGKLYWGGSEQAINGLHWIEGAVQRGNEVAASILSDCGRLTATSARYLDWLRYMAKRSLTLYYQLQPWWPRVGQTLSALDQWACAQIVAAGATCVPGTHFRVTNLNGNEANTYSRLQTALVDDQAIQSALDSAANLAGLLYGLVGPIIYQ